MGLLTGGGVCTVIFLGPPSASRSLEPFSILATAEWNARFSISSSRSRRRSITTLVKSAIASMAVASVAYGGDVEVVR